MKEKIASFKNNNRNKLYLLDYAMKHLQKKPINKTNKKTIISFVKQLAAENMSIDRQHKYIYTTIKISEGVGNKVFSKLTKEDIKNFIGAINNSDFSEWTKRDYRIIMKRLMKYVREQEGIQFSKGEYPAEVTWLSGTIKRQRKKHPEELLTIDDVKKLAQGMVNLRDKAFCLFLYESGARIGEVLNVKIKDVEFDKFGARVTLFGKTGARKIRVIASSPAISNWLQQHPKRDNKESWLFCSLNHPTVGYQGSYWYSNKLLRVGKKRVGLDKPVNPHHFRHSRATELAKKLTEALLCAYMGWIVGSKEAATYVHLSGRDTDKAILALHGLAEEDKLEEKFSPIECPRCGRKNDPSAKFCMDCSLGLDDKSMINYDKQKEQATEVGFASMDILKDPDFREFYNEMLLTTWEKYKAMKNGK